MAAPGTHAPTARRARTSCRPNGAALGWGEGPTPLSAPPLLGPFPLPRWPHSVTFVVPGQVPGAGDAGRGVGGRVWPAGILVEGPVTHQLYRGRGGAGPLSEAPEHCPLPPSVGLRPRLSDHPASHGAPPTSVPPSLALSSALPGHPGPWTSRDYNLPQTHPGSPLFPAAFLQHLPLWEQHPSSVGTLHGPSTSSVARTPTALAPCRPRPCRGDGLASWQLLLPGSRCTPGTFRTRPP